jgi:hypothetical protein
MKTMQACDPRDDVSIQSKEPTNSNEDDQWEDVTDVYEIIWNDGAFSHSQSKNSNKYEKERRSFTSPY